MATAPAEVRARAGAQLPAGQERARQAVLTFWSLTQVPAVLRQANSML